MDVAIYTIIYLLKKINTIMKKTIFLSLIFIIIAISSCNKEGYEVTTYPEAPYLRMWAMHACWADFDYVEATPEEWKNKVLDTLKARNFDVETHQLGYIEQEPFVGCGNCMRSGDYLDVIVPDDQREDLMSLGFSEY